MTIGTALFHAHASTRFQTLGSEIATLQSEISSGRNDPRPSADPLRALRLSAADEQGARLERYSTNLETAKGRLGLADAAVAAGTDVMQRLRELALSASTGTLSASQRSAITSETRELRGSLLDVANARDEAGRALFGGNMTEDDPYTDIAGSVVYQGDTGGRSLRVSESAKIDTAVPGPEIFDGMRETAPGDPTDIFQAIDTFLTALADPDDAGMDVALRSITEAGNHLADGRARIGAIAARVELQADAIDARQLRLDEALSSLRELDLAQTVTDLSRKLLTRDAAQQSFVSIGRTNLFDYMR